MRESSSAEESIQCDEAYVHAVRSRRDPVRQSDDDYDDSIDYVDVEQAVPIAEGRNDEYSSCTAKTPLANADTARFQATKHHRRSTGTRVKAEETDG